MEPFDTFLHGLAAGVPLGVLIGIPLGFLLREVFERLRIEIGWGAKRARG
jgi:hypothetical protein